MHTTQTTLDLLSLSSFCSVFHGEEHACSLTTAVMGLFLLFVGVTIDFRMIAD